MSEEPDAEYDVTDTGIIGDMGVALARLRCGQMGHLFRDQPTHDRGIDAEIELAEGRIATGRILKAQVKCGSSYFARSSDTHFVVPVNYQHYEHWRKHSVPVIFLLANHATDECFWELVDASSISSTGKNFAIRVPRANIFDRSSRNAISRLATPSVPTKSFDVFDIQDNSTGAARRLAYYLTLQPSTSNWNRASVEQVIRQVTAEARTSRHFRDEISASLWEGSSPSVVWVYVYTDQAHRDLGRYLVRALWVDPTLNKDYRPLDFSVPWDAAGLQIDWNANLLLALETFNDQSGAEARYIGELENILPEIRNLAFDYWRFILGGKGGEHFDAKKLVSEFTPVIESIDSLPECPTSCARISKQVAATRAELDGARSKAESAHEPSVDDKNFNEIFYHAQSAFFKCLIVRHEIDERA